VDFFVTTSKTPTQFIVCLDIICGLDKITTNKPPSDRTPNRHPIGGQTATNNNNKNKKNERMKETLYLKKTYKKVRFAFFPRFVFTH